MVEAAQISLDEKTIQVVIRDLVGGCSGKSGRSSASAVRLAQIGAGVSPWWCSASNPGPGHVGEDRWDRCINAPHAFKQRLSGGSRS